MNSDDINEPVRMNSPIDVTANSNATINHSTQSPGRNFLYREWEPFSPRSTKD